MAHHPSVRDSGVCGSAVSAVPEMRECLVFADADDGCRTDAKDADPVSSDAGALGQPCRSRGRMSLRSGLRRHRPLAAAGRPAL